MKRHPWNTAFEWADHTGPTRRLSAAEVQQFDVDGYLVLPDLLDAATIAEVRADLDEQDPKICGRHRAACTQKRPQILGVRPGGCAPS